MPAWTEEELHRLYLMRRQEMADSEREREMWNGAPTGWSESSTVYVIEYRLNGGPSWYNASPFYEPLRTKHDETHSKEEAHTVAAAILAGKWNVTKQGDPSTRNITAVRVIERVASAKIISTQWLDTEE